MADIELDTTQASFPSYAELTQTQGWGQGDARVHASPDDVAETIDTSKTPRYSEGAVLGTGGMGKVLLARDARIGRDVAVKVLHADRDKNAQARARFLREAQVQGQLEHPSIVPVYDISRRSDGSTFFTMRRVQGRTLATIIDSLREGLPDAKTRYTRRELLTAFATVCLTMDYAHSRGVVHRDLTPANIMLGDFGEVYVLDWGLARLLDDSEAPSAAPISDTGPREQLSLSGAVLGTPLYMAPEQSDNPNVGPSADVYSLGLILFEILTYQRAREPHTLFDPVEVRATVRAPHLDVPPELETICLQATALQVKDRYPSARVLHDALGRFLDGDRELEQRRQLAARHVDAARSALVAATGPEQEQRVIAMTELTRAVALDPHNEQNVAMLADILANPPPVPPAAVEREYERETRRIVQLGAKQSLLSLATWGIAAAILILIGIEHPWQVPLVITPVVLTMIVHVVILRQKDLHMWTQYTTIILLMAGGVTVSCLYGPFVLTPVIIATNAIALQAHPIRRVQQFGVVLAVVSIVVAVGLELTGIMPRSYSFADGNWTIVPQLVKLPREATMGFITLALISSILMTCTFIAKLRNDLTGEQLRRATQVWHFKQLGARLVDRDLG